ncbi:MAG: P1 family peptidase [Brachymonas sp.]|jgi:L-aminopeptidase/D-esterase-like protein|nr:P1 family peptidase [Brachymonas sp.]
MQSFPESHHQSTEVDCITRVQGIEVGHYSHPQRPTGCSVVIARESASAAVDVRGAAPGTRETDLLRAGNLVEKVHAILLTGGSAWGLAAADGVVRWLEEQHIGLDTGYGKLPLVPAAVLFDLAVGDPRIRPDADCGYRACMAASSHPCAQAGNIGAGTGATVGKLYGPACAMKGGAASASISLNGVTVGALIACNAVGDIHDPATGALLAGARTTPQSLALRNSTACLLQGDAPSFALPGTNTVIGVIATDAALTRSQLQRLAVAGHDGLARCISPAHTQLDGDTLFALSTAQAQQGHTLDMITLCAMAAEAVSRAVLRSIRAAQTLHLPDLWLPCFADLNQAEAHAIHSIDKHC